MLILWAGGGLAFWSSLRQDSGSNVIFYLMLSVFLLAPTPLLLYRLYALLQASYTLERDGLRIRWGLRGEDIPLPRSEGPGEFLLSPVLFYPATIPGRGLGSDPTVRGSDG